MKKSQYANIFTEHALSQVRKDRAVSLQALRKMLEIQYGTIISAATLSMYFNGYYTFPPSVEEQVRTILDNLDQAAA
jgi:hypothetical protein